ncbi:Probable Co/Zn/Cd efflux system membrane fusion protein [hydrothermal vent metagenome]|jgi:copper chaperone CopZ|uniref:Probable Co/Zn/Cd efflux system membrane fusion protein n=1 Tax=hydrothermal vent metagenome TaxID=652676 RepID=A0A3B0QQ73_9ZZZZ
MKNKNSSISIKVLVLLLLVVSTLNLEASNLKTVNDDSKTYIKIWVDGMACPFCAYGLEKKIKKIDSSGDFFVEINEGFISFSVKSDKVPSEVDLKKTVKEAGFFARKIEISKTPFKQIANE